MNAREAADFIADKVWEWSKSAGSPLVLTVEDRDEIEEVIASTRPSHDAETCPTCSARQRA